MAENKELREELISLTREYFQTTQEAIYADLLSQVFEGAEPEKVQPKEFTPEVKDKLDKLSQAMAEKGAEYYLSLSGPELRRVHETRTLLN